MQKALKNPRFKKIWEEINWKIRHPEAKSLEEALQEEISPFNSCMVFVDMTKLGYVMTSNEHLHVVSYSKFEYFAMEPVYSRLIKVWDIQKKKPLNGCQILGKPITLEDILLLLAKNGKARNEIGIILLENGNLYIKPITGGSYDFKWEYSKPFYEQNPETWEKISELIK